MSASPPRGRLANPRRRPHRRLRPPRGRPSGPPEARAARKEGGGGGALFLSFRRIQAGATVNSIQGSSPLRAALHGGGARGATDLARHRPDPVVVQPGRARGGGGVCQRRGWHGRFGAAAARQRRLFPGRNWGAKMAACSQVCGGVAAGLRAGAPGPCGSGRVPSASRVAAAAAA